MKSLKIRDKDFTTLYMSSDNLSLSKIFPAAKPAEPPAEDAKPPASKFEISVGLSDSLLVVSDSTEAIDKILGRVARGMAPALEESAVFQADYGARLRESPIYFWLNTKSLMDFFVKAPAAKAPADAPDEAATAATGLESFFSATGLRNLTSASLSYKRYPEGDCTLFFLGVPEGKRPALLNIFAAEAKDSAPPSFVPADVTKFWRWRLNVARSWNALESMLKGVVPAQYMVYLNTMFMAGKDKDEHYDLKSELLNNLGDNMISYVKAPKASPMADLRSPPTLFLLASPNPDKLAAASKVLLGVFTLGAPITDREFLGRTIHTMTPPSLTTNAPPSGLSFSASGGYVAFSSDPATLENTLRRDTKSKALADLPDLTDAAQKVGGTRTGLFASKREPNHAPCI